MLYFKLYGIMWHVLQHEPHQNQIYLLQQLRVPETVSRPYYYEASSVPKFEARLFSPGITGQ